MTFQTLYGGELFCMPDAFGDRHALRAWGTCNTDTEQYSIGQPKTVPQVATLHRVRADPDRERARSFSGSWGKHSRPSSFPKLLVPTCRPRRLRE